MTGAAAWLFIVSRQEPSWLDRAEKAVAALQKYELRWRETAANGNRSSGHIQVDPARGVRLELRGNGWERWALWRAGEVTWLDRRTGEYVRSAEGESMQSQFPSTPEHRIPRLRRDLLRVEVEEGKVMRAGKQTISATRLRLRPREPGESLRVERWLDQRTGLPVRIEEWWAAEGRAGIPAGGSRVDLEWLRVGEPLEEDVFVLRLPRNARRVERLAPRIEGHSPQPRDLRGGVPWP